jgi:tRNA dimethylallyltransferase
MPSSDQVPAQITKPPLVVILGPTAVGKTEISLIVAEHLAGEIVSADSRLFYRGMDIGTAKPTREERSRVPHHLIDMIDPDEAWSLRDFQQSAQEAITAIHTRGRLPLLVGGTGQFLRCITEGWELPKQAPHLKLRNEIQKWGEQIGAAALHAQLSIIDPQAASVIEPNNLRRTVRALEVIVLTGKRFSEQRQRRQSPYHILQLGLIRPRPELYARIDARIEQMLSNGWLDEVQALLDQGYDPSLTSMSAIGYQQLAAYLVGDITLEEATKEIKRLTRQFVRRQANWFKMDDPSIHWFTPGSDTVEQIVRLVQETFGSAIQD